MSESLNAFALFFSLLNPFLMSIYMLGIIRNSDAKVFNMALIQGSLISFIVFIIFAKTGEAFFNEVLHVRFESFQIFGGIIFLVIGYRYVFEGADTIGVMRGAPSHLAGTIAMPFMIGPGTISASVITGIQLSLMQTILVIFFTLFLTCSLLILMKYLHDHLQHKYSNYIDLYVDIVGRVAALLIGTIAIDMIVTGVTGMMSESLNAFALFFSLLNPFLMSIYMLGIIRNSDAKVFNMALIQGSLISFIVFIIFAKTGEAFFNEVLHVRFESFQIFGGIIFLVIGYRYVFEGADTIGVMRGAPSHLAGTIAMPFMIGPGTISASVITGIQLSLMQTILVIFFTLFLTCSLLILMKYLHDHLQHKYSNYIDLYVDIVGRVAALLIGTIAIDMIVTGVTGILET